MKKLKLRIAKFNKLLIVQQLEKAGEFKRTNHVKVDGDLYLFAASIDLQESTDDKSVNCREFIDNAERDEYAANLIKWITEEQFDVIGKLEVGKMCEVSDDGKAWIKRIYAGELAPIFGKKRFLAQHCMCDVAFFSAKYARPLGAQSTIDGDIYTWETEE